MTGLHLVFASGEALDLVLAVRLPGEPVVLLGEGVYALLSDSDHLQTLRTAGELVLLEPDARARGLVPSVTTGYLCISYPELVAMTTRHQPVRSWH